MLTRSRAGSHLEGFPPRSSCSCPRPRCGPSRRAQRESPARALRSLGPPGCGRVPACGACPPAAPVPQEGAPCHHPPPPRARPPFRSPSPQDHLSHPPSRKKSSRRPHTPKIIFCPPRAVAFKASPAPPAPAPWTSRAWCVGRLPFPQPFPLPVPWRAGPPGSHREPPPVGQRHRRGGPLLTRHRRPRPPPARRRGRHRLPGSQRPRSPHPRPLRRPAAVHPGPPAPASVPAPRPVREPPAWPPAMGVHPLPVGP